MPKEIHVGAVSSDLLPSRVLETVTRLTMVGAGERVLIGLSGGADSMALTEILLELSRRFDPPLALAAAHLNHGLRAEADEDEGFCREVARRLAIPFVSQRTDVGVLAARSKRSIEDEGRRARYGFLEAQAARWNCQRIAVGHTLDDQAETLLLRLLRGSGGRGLGSVHPTVESRLIRPLIEVRRADIEDYLRGRGIPHRDDGSNADPRYTRNRLRHRVLPELERDFNPRLVETLGRAAALFRDEDDWMESETRRVFDVLAVPEKGAVRFDVDAFARLHPALRRRLVRRAVEMLRGGLRDVGQVHVEDVLALLAPGKSGREVHLPGLVADRSFGELRIRTAWGSGRQKRPERGYNGFEYRLSIPARIPIPEGGGVFSARLNPEGRLQQGGVSGGSAVGNEVVVSVAVAVDPLDGRQARGVDPVDRADSAERTVYDAISTGLPELTIRTPRAGDRFHALGAPGSKPLMRYLMDRKVDREQRRVVPLVVRSGNSRGARGERGGEEILWVVGHGVSESCRLLPGRRLVDLKWVTKI